MTVKKKSGNKNKGFASNPDNINRGGRPKGSRNKSTLLKAQLNLDDMSFQATDIISAIMNNDKAILGLTESENVPLTLRLAAAKEALSKAIANEKDKAPDESTNKADNEDEDDSRPIFSSVPIKSA